MCQATALRLQQEKSHREQILEESKWKYDHGDAPFEEAIKEFNYIEKKKILTLETAILREEELQSQQQLSNIKTTAEPRPTAYIPDDIGIPKPYGNSAPFKPTEIGLAMRRIKPPIVKTIEM